ncbi:hypothetical protein [Nocardia niwae]|uniref:Uncharacterized protein n=1 Tax=Nocardia niwae TaxID=626084 RepID=A0ABV2XFE9_9NOCA
MGNRLFVVEPLPRCSILQMAHLVTDGVVRGIAGRGHQVACPHRLPHGVPESLRGTEEVLVQDHEGRGVLSDAFGSPDTGTGIADHGGDQYDVELDLLPRRETVDYRIPDRQSRVDGDARLVQTEHLDAERLEQLPGDGLLGVSIGLGRPRGVRAVAVLGRGFPLPGRRIGRPSRDLLRDPPEQGDLSVGEIVAAGSGIERFGDESAYGGIQVIEAVEPRVPRSAE